MQLPDLGNVKEINLEGCDQLTDEGLRHLRSGGLLANDDFSVVG
jgi:hypothetical protein